MQIPALTEEKVLELLRYKVSEPLEDVKIEVQDFLRSNQSEQKEKSESEKETLIFPESEDFSSTKAETGTETGHNEKILSLYRENFDYYFELASVHLRKPHILLRNQVLGGILLYFGARTYADWGAGSGRDCIIASKLGVSAHHIDIGGAGQKFAEFRYKARGLDVKIWDITHRKPQDKFDVISNFDCLEHVPNPIETLKDMIERLRLGGILVVAADFYNIAIDGEPDGEQKYHLSENFVYGGIWEEILQKVGMRKVYGRNSSFVDTALASPVIFVKEREVKDIKAVIKEESLKLLRKFRSYFDHHIKILEGW